MSYPRTIESSEFYRLRGYLDAIQDFAITGNHEALFDLFLYDLTQSEFDPFEIFQMAYANEELEKANLIKCTAGEMIEEANSALRLSFEPLNIQPVPSERMEYANRFNLPGFWEQIKACANYETGAIFKYDAEFKHSNLYWSFAYIIYSQQEGSCLILHGGGS
jgi:hypothetical protein